MYRGDIWWANLPNPTGSEPSYRRPVLVIQDDTFNQSNINTVIIVAITSNTSSTNYSYTYKSASTSLSRRSLSGAERKICSPVSENWYNLRLADAPGNVFLSTQDSGLPRDSVANVSQILTIDKSLLTERVSVLDDNIQAAVDEGLRLALFL